MASHVGVLPIAAYGCLWLPIAAYGYLLGSKLYRSAAYGCLQGDSLLLVDTMTFSTIYKL